MERAKEFQLVVAKIDLRSTHDTTDTTCVDSLPQAHVTDCAWMFAVAERAKA